MNSKFKYFFAAALIFFLFGMLTVLINMFAIWLLFDVMSEESFYPILLIILFLIPVVAFFILLIMLCKYLKKSIASWRWIDTVSVAVIAFTGTILPYYIFA